MGRTSDLRRVVLYTVAVLMASFGVTSIASAQSVITNTGANSFNSATSGTSTTCTVTNTNDVSASNQTSQDTTSGNATDSNNQQGSSPWTVWSALNPAAAQTAGTSYNAWRSEVTNWIAARTSGAGWTSTDSNPTWAPSGNDWESFYPMLWQANGQTFSNWLTAVESYLNSNSANWILGWPASATSGIFGDSATSGPAASNNSSDFSINISDTASPSMTGSCGQSTAGSGGMGGGLGSSSTGGTTAGGVEGFSHGAAVSATTASGNGGQGSSQGSSYAAYPSGGTYVAGEASGYQDQGNTGNGSSSGSGGGSTSTTPPVGTPSAGASVSDTGPCSTNIASSTATQATTVSNINTVNVTNATTQTTTSGNSTVSNNGDMSTSGGSSSNNGTGLDANVNG
jgi:hypothetical protein